MVKTVLDILTLIIVMAVLAITFGCSTVVQTTDKPYYNYRAEMSVSINGRPYSGLALTKLGGPIDIQIISPITLNRVMISTCSRNEVVRNIDSGWFDKVTNKMTYHFEPTPLEVDGQCPILIQAFNDHVQKAWAMVFFSDDQNLQANVNCNGQNWTTQNGITVCQTKAGLEQQLFFMQPVEFEAKSECTIKTDDKMKFLIRSNSIGWCKATFSDGRGFHDLILLGYDQVVDY